MNDWPGLSDTETIFLVLAAIYFWECSCWLRGTAVCFSGASGKHRLLRSCAPLENERGRVVFTNLRPQATSFVCQSWPVVFDAEGIVLPSVPAGAVAEPAGRWLPYESVQDVTSDGREVFVNRQPMASLTTASHAGFVAKRLRSVVAAKPGARGRAIESLLDELFDVAAARKRLADLERSTATLRSSCSVFLVYTFVAGPIMYYGPSLAWWRNIWFYLAGFVCCWFFVIFQYRRSRRKLGEHCTGTSGHVAMLFLSPASAMRSAESLSRELLVGFEPLAVAAAVCSADEFRSFAAASLRGWLYPLSPCEETDAAVRARAWFSEQFSIRQRAVVEGNGLDIDALLSEPARSEDAAGYCPRCLRQYVMAEGPCSECAGVALRPFSVQGVAALARRPSVLPKSLSENRRAGGTPTPQRPFSDWL